MLDENFLQLLNPFSALVAGFITSLHCMGMCGPLACTMLKGGQSKSGSKFIAFGGYHLGKLLSYILLGALAGAIGSRFVSATSQAPTQILTWAMAAFFLLVAIGLDRMALKIPLIGKLSQAVMRQAYKVSGTIRGLTLGLATPFIPCGPLYVIIWVAAVAGGAATGATMLAMFGLGTIPGLLATQLGWSFITVKFEPARLARWRRNTAIIACLLLVMRSLVDLSYESLILLGELCH